MAEETRDDCSTHSDDTEEPFWSPLPDSSTTTTDIIKEAWNSSTDDKDRVSTTPHPLIKSWYELKIDGELVSYYCELCFKPTSNRAYMRHHLKQHFGRYIYQCNVCGQSFPIYRLVHLHKRSHDYGLSCNNNNDNDMNSMGLLHYSGVSLLRKNPNTSKSAIKTMTAGNGAEEGEVHDSEEDNQQQGRMEGTMSRALTDLLKALRLTDVSQTNLKNDEDDSDNSSNNKNDNNSFPFKCSACSVGFSSPDALIGHIITEGELSKLYGPSSVVSSSLKKRNPVPTRL